MVSEAYRQVRSACFYSVHCTQWSVWHVSSVVTKPCISALSPCPFPILAAGLTKGLFLAIAQLTSLSMQAAEGDEVQVRVHSFGSVVISASSLHLVLSEAGLVGPAACVGPVCLAACIRPACIRLC